MRNDLHTVTLEMMLELFEVGIIAELNDGELKHLYIENEDIA